MASICQWCGTVVENGQVHVCKTYYERQSINNPSILHPEFINFCLNCVLANSCENVKLPICYKKIIN